MKKKTLIFYWTRTSLNQNFICQSFQLDIKLYSFAVWFFSKSAEYWLAKLDSFLWSEMIEGDNKIVDLLKQGCQTDCVVK